MSASALSGSVGPDDDDAHAAARASRSRGRGLEDLAVALLPDQPADDPAHDVVGPGAQRLRAARRPRVGSTARRVEAGEVDAVAEQVQLVARDAAARRSIVDVLGVLDELGVRARGGDALERVDDAPASASGSSGSA